MKTPFITCILLALLAGCKKDKQAPQAKINYLDVGYIEVLDQELNEILDPTSKLEILSEGHDWTEGPLWLEDTKTLLFSDIPRNTVYSWDKENGTKEYLNPSGFTGTDFEGSEPGANGLLLDPQGNLILSKHGNRQEDKMISKNDHPKPEFPT